MPKSTKDQEKPEREMSTENVFNAAHTKNVAFRAGCKKLKEKCTEPKVMTLDGWRIRTTRDQSVVQSEMKRSREGSALISVASQPDSKKAAKVPMKPTVKCATPTHRAWRIESATGVNPAVHGDTRMGVFRWMKSKDSTSSCQ